MGWKNVKEHYRIEHQVRVEGGAICIGSAYIYDLIVIGADGNLAKRFGRDNEDLVRIQSEMDADLEKLRSLVLQQDTFSESLAVFTYKDGEIIEQRCEKLDWPNVTHCGAMMYENTHSADKQQVVNWAKRNLDIGIKWAREQAVEDERKLKATLERLSRELAFRAKLEANFPTTSAEQSDAV